MSIITGPQHEMNDTPPIHDIVSGALFDFGGFLTSLDDDFMVGSHSDASHFADLIGDFHKRRGLTMWNSDVESWQKKIGSRIASRVAVAALSAVE